MSVERCLARRLGDLGWEAADHIVYCFSVHGKDTVYREREMRDAIVWRQWRHTQRNYLYLNGEEWDNNKHTMVALHLSCPRSHSIWSRSHQMINNKNIFIIIPKWYGASSHASGVLSICSRVAVLWWHTLIGTLASTRAMILYVF